MDNSFVITTVIQGLLCAFFIWGLFNENKLAILERRVFAYIKAYIRVIRCNKMSKTDANEE